MSECASDAKDPLGNYGQAGLTFIVMDIVQSAMYSQANVSSIVVICGLGITSVKKGMRGRSTLLSAVWVPDAAASTGSYLT